MSRKGYFSILLINIMLIAVMSGCGQNAGTDNGGIRILFCLNEMDTFRQTIVNSATEKAAQEGVMLDVVDAQGSMENQVEQLKAASKENYDVIVCSPISIDTMVQLKMSAGDIPIVFINSCPEEKQLQAGKYVYVG